MLLGAGLEVGLASSRAGSVMEVTYSSSIVFLIRDDMNLPRGFFFATRADGCAEPNCIASRKLILKLLTSRGRLLAAGCA